MRMVAWNKRMPRYCAPVAYCVKTRRDGAGTRPSGPRFTRMEASNVLRDGAHGWCSPETGRHG